METALQNIRDTTDPLLLDDQGELEGYGNETYTMLKYVLNEIAEEQSNPQNNSKEDPFRRAQRYTGLHLDTLQKICHDGFTVDKLTEIDRKCIHDKLMSFYLDKNIMPNATELYNSLQDDLPPYEDIRSFRKMLTKMGYIFKKNEKSFVVYEKPSVRFERFLYLKKLIQYRQDERHIYYISGLSISDDKDCNINGGVLNKKNVLFGIFFAVSSVDGVKFSEKVVNFEKGNFNSWILHDVIPNLQANSVVNSVVILDNSKYYCDTYCETPSKTSSSYVIKEWLKFHDIPFSESINLVDLYTLANKYTDLNRKLYKPDIWLRQNGHDVLRLPYCINEMTPAAYVRDYIKSLNSENEAFIIQKIKDMDATILSDFNLTLAEEESRLHDLENKLDIVLDSLTPSINLEADLYLPYLSDSE
ncbi:uncharacterized protein LOC112050190 [Bicyclus anynana]|uniref:Uncharacterized protein LOC112050190 n=1 Tax=Bicyclus anynana TaxID=110368 RepID=A0A6J1N8Y5_BICAN|nr:uncharacterized protein LOC112050190 [Bicyclus anynana]